MVAPSLALTARFQAHTLHYVMIFHATALIKRTGKAYWFLKVDITSAFMVLSIHPLLAVLRCLLAWCLLLSHQTHLWL